MKKRVISALLCCAMIFSLAVPAFAAETEAVTKEYTGKILAAINTDRKEDLTFTAQVLNDIEEGEETEEAEEDLAFLQGENAVLNYLSEQMVPMTYEEALQAESEEDEVSAQCLSKEYRIGDKKKIVADLASANETSVIGIFSYIANNKKSVECVFIGEYCTVWLETGKQDKKETAIEFGKFADEMIPTELDMFGDYRIDTDKDGKFAIFMYDFSEDSSAAGYFLSNDTIDTLGKVGDVWIKDVFSGMLGNKCDCVHINTLEKDVRQLKTVFVHEYQHYINHSSLYVGKTNIDEIESTDTFVDEGFSIAAQMCLFITEEYLKTYIYSFSDFVDYTSNSLFNWQQLDYGNYGMSFALFQYVRTRYAAFVGDAEGEYPGEEVYKLIREKKCEDSLKDTFDIIADILYPVSEYPELADTKARVRQLTVDFWLAALCKEKEGVYGFNGERWSNYLNVKFEDLKNQEYTIRSGMAAFFMINDENEGTAKIECDNDNMVFVEFSDVGNTLTLDPNGGVGEKIEYKYRTGYWFSDPMWTKAGCEFLGWSKNPEAETPDYRVGDGGIVEEDTTVYAVWGSATQLVVDNENTVEANGSRGYQFTPEEDGAYYIESDSNISGYILCADGTVLSKDFSGFGLDAGSLYDFRINLDSEEDGTFTLKKRDTYYGLHYVMDDGSVRDCSYKTSYIVEKPIKYNIVEEKKTFIGWSENKDDDTAKHQPGDTITLTKDTTLYATYVPWKNLVDGEEYIVPENAEVWKYVTFTPEKTASYKLEVASEVGFEYKIFDEADEYYCGGRENTVVNLEEGETYTIHLSNADSITLSFNSNSLKRKFSLNFEYLDGAYVGIYYKTVNSISVRAQGTVRIPDYEVYITGGMYHFIGWKDEFTGRIYKIGDTVEIKKDTALTAVYKLNTIPNGFEDVFEITLKAYSPLEQIKMFLMRFKRIVLILKFYLFGTF